MRLCCTAGHVERCAKVCNKDFPLAAFSSDYQDSVVTEGRSRKKEDILAVEGFRLTCRMQVQEES
jgi:hypothetical protein